MSELLRNVNARTKLVGTNKLEILMFSVGKNIHSGREETFGINVFKVREVMRIPPITQAPEMPNAVEGMVSLRGVFVPVIDLARYVGMQVEEKPEIMIVTEYNGRSQGFLVKSVDNILRLDWSAMRVPPEMLASNMGGLVTAVTELKDKRLVMMIDVEKILADTTPDFGQEESLFKNVKPLVKERVAFFADDSSVARSQIKRTLDALQISYSYAINGVKAWEALVKMADYAEAQQLQLKDSLHVIITDVEMPEMDGYMLTKKIKDDKRFAGIPVVMHSSLSSTSNEKLARTIGVDEYVPKFEAQQLAHVLAKLLG